MATLQRFARKLVPKPTFTSQITNIATSRVAFGTKPSYTSTNTPSQAATWCHQQQFTQRQSTRRGPTSTTSRRHFTSETTPQQTPDPQKAAQQATAAPKSTPVATEAAAAATPKPTPTPTSTAAPKPTTASVHPIPDSETVQTRASHLDRSDNVHSYEKGQFQVLTGKNLNEKNLNWLYYLTAIGFASLGMSFVAVPLYQAFCQMTGSGGQLRRDQQIDELNRYMSRTQDLGDVTLRPIQVTFQATVDVNLDWSFYPCQNDITLRIGETALAFFRARNDGKKPVIGVSTYNVLPAQAGLYFNKIQCFCFDEQRLRAGEEIDMPIFFFLDPAMADDWRMDNIDQVTLCYTFFEVQEDEVEEAVKGLNEVRSLHNERIAASSLGQQTQPLETLQPTKELFINTADNTTTVVNGDGTKTISTTLTINIPDHIQEHLNSPHKDVGYKPNHNDDDEEQLICPIIPPVAMHNPSGISLMQSSLPRIVSDEEAKANQAKVQM